MSCSIAKSQNVATKLKYIIIKKIYNPKHNHTFMYQNHLYCLPEQAKPHQGGAARPKPSPLLKPAGGKGWVSEGEGPCIIVNAFLNAR